jgi:hypothetical protein
MAKILVLEESILIESKRPLPKAEVRGRDER